MLVVDDGPSLKFPETVRTLDTPTVSVPVLEKSPAVVNVAPFSTWNTPALAVSGRTGANDALGPPRVIDPWLIVMVGEPGKSRVAPPKTAQEPPVSVVPDTWATPSVRDRLPESTAVVPVLL